MVISAREWWAHETRLKCLARLRELKFSTCFQDGIKLWPKAASFCLPPTPSGHFGPTGLMLAGVFMHLWIVFVFSFPKPSPMVRPLCFQIFYYLKADRPNLFNLPKIISRWNALWVWEPLLTFRDGRHLLVESTGPQIGETGSVTVWIFTQWVFLLCPLWEGNRSPWLGNSIRDTL